jgi:hypothetical protein
MSDLQYRAHARQEAGHEALRVVATHGEDLGTDIILGYFTGFTLALVAVLGREGAEEAFRSIIGPPAQGRPSLRVIING